MILSVYKIVNFQKSGGARGNPRTAFSCHIIEEVRREVNT
ncbi:hypothetical protein SUBVAR_04970 [Subdoligranulum variabile DSM 15176]|uniref:Uncharacterized protein n=1 Tax=Subdoligranulum variabile DSM 15176 TaxID=411471 RepID=D1PKT6_9FIRM|nr:hypothetical protein SUBVAR_04970 [Subdoligranulum variabile DSM 15176]